MRTRRRSAGVPANRDSRKTAAEPARPFPRISRGDLAFACTLAILLLIVYSPAIGGGMLTDDSAYITKPELRSWHGLGRIWTEPGLVSQYYPFLQTMFWVEHRLWDGWLPGYHLVNVALHFAVALTVVAFMRGLQIRGAWLGGFLFALHPVNVQSVAWISEQKNTLSTLLYMATALSWLRFDRLRLRRDYAITAGLFAIALLSKSETATLPAALAVLCWWKYGRLDWRRDLKPLAPLMALGIVSGLVTEWVERTYEGATGPEFSMNVLERFILAGRAAWFYLSKMVWPHNLMFIYPRWHIEPGAPLQYLWPVSGLAVIALAFSVRRRWRGLLAAVLCYLGALLPALGFVNIYAFIFSYVWDHFQYLAALNFCIAAAAGLALLPTLRGSRILQPRWSMVAGAVLAGILSTATWSYAREYRSAYDLYAANERMNPGNWQVQNNFGIELVKLAGRQADAVAHLRQSVLMKPLAAEPHYNLGGALEEIPGHSSEALAEYETAVRLKPLFPDAQLRLGMRLMSIQGRLPDAIGHLRWAVLLEPDSADAHRNLGAALMRTPNGAESARAEFEKAFQLDPSSPEVLAAIGGALAGQPGADPGEAARFLAEAVRKNPDSASAHNNLGGLLDQQHKFPEAIGEFREALRLKPDFAEAHMNLANTLAETGNSAEAVVEYRAVLHEDPHYPEAHNNLGNALIALGEKTAALAEYTEALADNPDSADVHINLGAIYSEMPGGASRALSEFQAALKLAPNRAETHFFLGEIYLRIPGRSENAAAEFEASLRLRPDYAEARQELSKLRR